MRFFLFAALLLVSAATLMVGEIPWPDVREGVLRRFSGEGSWNPLLDERLPRLIVILCTGASLAVSGAVMQSLFHNPLASPGVLGISCGGSLATVAVFVLGWHLNYPYAIPAAAVIGSLLTIIIVQGLSSFRGEPQLKNLILTGIAISTLLIAVEGTILYALRDRWHLIQTVTEWHAGSSADKSWQHVHMQLPLTIAGLLGCWGYRRELDMLALGDEEAKNLGVEVDKMRRHLFLSVALLTGGALAGMGIIAFFGLVLPHILRRLQGPCHLKLIPHCILGGSVTLCLMDLILRINAVHAFSIGNISAILGGIFFLILLFGSRERAYA